MPSSKPKPSKRQQPKGKLPLSHSNKKPSKPRRSNTKSNVRQFSFKISRSLRLEVKLKRSKPKKNSKNKGQKKPQSKQTVQFAMLIAISLGGIFYFGYDILSPADPPKVYSLPAPEIEKNDDNGPQTASLLPRSQPKKLRIPDIDVNTSLVTVGRKSDGTMETPSSSEVAGWYRLSPTPGELGPAIIVGHVDSKSGPAVFWDLSTLQPGQLLHVIREDGSQATFKISKIKQFSQNEFPTDTVYGDIDKAGLRLITCGGSYDRGAGHYTHNTVVFADLINN